MSEQGGTRDVRMTMELQTTLAEMSTEDLLPELGRIE